jgi:hypothetical protein
MPGTIIDESRYDKAVPGHRTPKALLGILFITQRD